MKVFILASAIFLLILVFVITSASLLVKFGEELRQVAEEFPPTLSPKDSIFQTILNKFNEQFKEKRIFIHLIVGHSENEAIETALKELEIRQNSGDFAGYAVARNQLISAIEKIISSESLSLNTVF